MVVGERRERRVRRERREGEGVREAWLWVEGRDGGVERDVVGVVGKEELWRD